MFKCDKMQRKARVLDFQERKTPRDIKSVVTFGFSSWVENKWAFTVTGFLYKFAIYSTHSIESFTDFLKMGHKDVMSKKLFLMGLPR